MLPNVTSLKKIVLQFRNSTLGYLEYEALPALFDVSSVCSKRKHKDKIFALTDFSNTWLKFCN